MNLLEQALNTKIQEVVCVSLKEDEKRRRDTLAECAKLGIHVKFHIVDRNPISGMQGCLESHLQLINYAKKNNLENILIIEDDVQFDVEAIRNMNITLPEDWEMFYLGYHVNKGYQYKENVLKLMSALTTHAYLLRNTVYDYIIDNINEDWLSIPEYHYQNQHEKPFFASNNHAIDIFYAKWVHHRRDKTYGAYPLLAYQRPSFSHIEQQNVDYTNLFKSKAQYYYDRFLGSFKGTFKISEDGHRNIEELCDHLKTLNFGKWDYVLVSDMTNLFHTRERQDKVDIYHNTICNKFSWDILSLTETWRKPKILDLMTHNEREQLCTTFPSVTTLIYQNKTKELYEFLEDKEDWARLRGQLSRYHIYYLRMTFVDKYRDPELVREHFEFPPLDKYQFSVYQPYVEPKKELVCVYLPHDVTYGSIKEKLGNLSPYDVYVCAPEPMEEDGVTYISRREMATLPKHKLIIVNEVMYFADHPLHSDDITMLMTEGRFTKSWKGMDIPYEGRSIFYNFIDRITRMTFVNEAVWAEFVQAYQLNSQKQTSFILEDQELPVSTEFRNTIITIYNEKYIDIYLAMFRQIKAEIPNMKMFIYNGDKKLQKDLKKDKDVFVIRSRTVAWNGDVLLDMDNVEHYKEAIPHGIICVGRNKDFCHVLLPDDDSKIPLTMKEFISLLRNPVKKRIVAENIHSTYRGVSFRPQLFA